MIAPGAPDIHCVNAQRIFGHYLGWTFLHDDAFPQLTGLRVDQSSWKDFKKHWYGKYLRQMIKAVWYGLAYGKSDYGFQTLEGIDGKMIGKTLAGQLVEGVKDAVPVMRKWHDWVANCIRKYGGVYTLGGRWLDVRELSLKDDWGFASACRKGDNFPHQGTGAEIVNDALVRVTACGELRNLGFRPFIQVHDEIGIRGPAGSGERAGVLLNKHMVNATANGVKLLVELQTSIGMGYDYYTAK
jgi:DNA polymerase I-like protein with 3'-5' exonuclease and polymerase domains